MRRAAARVLVVAPAGSPSASRFRGYTPARALRSVAASLSLLLASAAGAQTTFSGIGAVSAASNSQANAISADGSTVVGKTGSSTHAAFRWTSATGIISLGQIPGTGTQLNSEATAVSADGSVIAGWGNSNFNGANGGENEQQAFRWTQATGIVGLPAPSKISGFFGAAGFGISDDGSVIVGRADDGGRGRAAKWTQAGGLVLLDTGPGGFPKHETALGISGDGQVSVGESQTCCVGRVLGLQWDLAGVPSVISDSGSETGGLQQTALSTTDASADGTTIVGVRGDGRPMSWTMADGVHSLGSLPNSTGQNGGEATGVSADGTTIVGWDTTVDGPRAFVWDPLSGMRALDAVLTNRDVDLTGWTLLEAFDVSADGKKIVGRGINPAGGVQAWLVTLGDPPPPEPGFQQLSASFIQSFGHAISADGSTVVGERSSQPFRWTAETGAALLGLLPGGIASSFQSQARGVSADGSVVTGFSRSSFGGANAGQSTEAFRWTVATGMVGLGGIVKTTGSDGFFSSFGRGISDDGSLIVGSSASPGAVEPVSWTEAGGLVLLDQLPPELLGGVGATALGVSGDGQVIVGRATPAALLSFRATRWDTLGNITQIPGALEAVDASADGSVLVGRTGFLDPARWTQASGWQILGDLPGGNNDGEALSVSADGSVVVGWSNATGGQRAFLWKSGVGMRPLFDVITDLNIDVTGWTFTSAAGVSADGKSITGTAVNPQGTANAYLVVLPDAPLPSICGNGSLELGETCDDSNLADGDCCSSTCQLDVAGSACDDANACTVADACDGAGACVSGAPAACDDGAFCNGAETCNPSSGCQSGAPPEEDFIACTLDLCDEGSDTVTHLPVDAACDDANACNGTEACNVAFGCQAGTPLICADGDICTADTCDAALACQFPAIATCEAPNFDEVAVAAGSGVTVSALGGPIQQGGLDATFDSTGGTFSADYSAVPVSSTAELLGLLGDPIARGFAIVTDPAAIWDLNFVGGFTPPATLTFAYNESLLVPGIAEDELQVFHFTGSSWQALPSVVDAAANTVTATTGSFSRFALGKARGTRVCEVDGDGAVNSIDIGIIAADRDKPVYPDFDPRDPDIDGGITVFDARNCALQCDMADCSIVAGAGAAPAAVAVPIHWTVSFWAASLMGWAAVWMLRRRQDGNS